jgi:hypothetical protein
MKKSEIERLLKQEPSTVFTMAHDYWRTGFQEAHNIGFVIERLETTTHTNYTGTKRSITRAIGTQIRVTTVLPPTGYLQVEIHEQPFECDLKDIGWECLTEDSDGQWIPMSKAEWVADKRQETSARCDAHNSEQAKMRELVARWGSLGVLDWGSVYGDFVSLPKTFQNLIIKLTEAAERESAIVPA